MKLITIENIIKPLKLTGHSKATGKLYGNDIKIDIDKLTVAYMSQEIALEALEGTLGGLRYFFICPDCYNRRRKLYLTKLGLLCGACLDINKPTLNRSKTDCVYYWELAFKECLKVDPEAKHVDGYYSWADFPSRPKRMKRSKYYKHYRKFRYYMNKGDNQWL
ncbi:hypothetical protein V2U79_06700 [Streptococcus agalactiae]|uniref:hypothetical protein n=1 Tax=Streptococcus agalactiae TaxID=1311 RepID=UPI001374B6DA|nr:hypothetical protein [Streptococcus agalactiae]KAF1247416.1 hypothetical protein B8V62_01055 [Streptococcus agalactiae]HEN0625909.1 hypothetical protein [Streptococcus agalactiae]